MGRKLQRMLIYGERIVRVLLLSFCVYTLLYAVTTNFFPRNADTIVHNYYYILIASMFSLCAGFVLNFEMKVFKEKFQLDWIAENKEEYYCYEFIGLVWIGTFYFLVQMGMALIFYPELEQIKIFGGEHHLYPMLFTFNSIIIYIFYRLTVLKIQLIPAKQES